MNPQSENLPRLDVSGARTFYIPALDNLRLLAWFMVFLCHVLPERLGASGAADFIYQGLRSSGGYGVSIFFCLSAFLITRLLLLEKERTGDIAVLKFYARRILRIWPLYYLVLLTGVFIVPRFAPTFNTSVLDWLWWMGSFTGNMVMNKEHAAIMAIAPLWSVCVEEQFYAVWPWVVKKLSPRILETFCVAILVAAPVYRAFAASDGVAQSYIWYKTATHLDCFAAGALVAIHWDRWRDAQYADRACLVFVAAALVLVLQSTLAPLSAKVDYVLTPLQAASYSLVAMVGAAIVWSVSVATTDKPSAWQRFTRYGGRISYGLYCYHGVVIALTVAWQIPWAELAVVRFILTWVLAHLSFRFYESFFLRAKRRFQLVRSGPSAAL